MPAGRGEGRLCPALGSEAEALRLQLAAPAPGPKGRPRADSSVAVGAVLSHSTSPADSAQTFVCVFA